MMYRNDHDAALARLEVLERENRFLIEELTRAGARKPQWVRTSWLAGFGETLEHENGQLADELAHVRGESARPPTPSQPTDRSAWFALVCGLALFALNLVMCSHIA